MSPRFTLYYNNLYIIRNNTYYFFVYYRITCTFMKLYFILYVCVEMTFTKKCTHIVHITPHYPLNSKNALFTPISYLSVHKLSNGYLQRSRTDFLFTDHVSVT